MCLIFSLIKPMDEITKTKRKLEEASRRDFKSKTTRQKIKLADPLNSHCYSLWKM